LSPRCGDGHRDKLFRSWFVKGYDRDHLPLDQGFDEEIELHMEMRTRELVAGGMDPETRVPKRFAAWATWRRSSRRVWTLAESEIEKCA
jgi:hypothetical protein